MTVPVYSTCFFALAGVAGLSTYPVPAGYKAKLHNMTLWVRDDGPAGFGDFLTVALDASDMYVWTIDATTINKGIYQWDGGEVFSNALYLNMLSTAYAFRANGILLTLP